MIKEGDFVKLEYTGTYDGKIFDTTDENLAKKENLFNKNTIYGPVTIVVGAGHLIKGLEEALIGKKEGEEFEITIPPEKAFGKKNPKLLKIIPLKTFKEQKINPYPGMTINVDNLLGVIVSVSAGRVIVDFNHPLAGKELTYKVKIHKIVNDKKEQLSSLVELYSNMHCDVNINEDNATVTCEEDIPENAKKVITNDAKKYINLKDVKFNTKSKTTNG
jgi:FKBP-type peptidyl-prolyl cis-trans isomerase 2